MHKKWTDRVELTKNADGKLSEAELLNALILEQPSSEFHCKKSLELRKIVKILEQFNNSGHSLENANSEMISNSSSNLKKPKQYRIYRNSTISSRLSKFHNSFRFYLCQTQKKTKLKFMSDHYNFQNPS